MAPALCAQISLSWYFVILYKRIFCVKTQTQRLWSVLKRRGAHRTPNQAHTPSKPFANLTVSNVLAIDLLQCMSTS